MPKNVNRYYWLCQIGGWGFVGLFAIVANTTVLETNLALVMVYKFTAVFIVPGLITTHLFRKVIKSSGWLQLPVEKALPKFVIGIVLTCVGCGLIRIGLVDVMGLVNSKKSTDFLAELTASASEYGIPVIPWTLIYYFYHYIENSRK
ncbi:MAG TPA: hypothetical protein VGR89_03720, partial [Puia sp.]|nr:hypothetical protein [Puia sp.]